MNLQYNKQGINHFGKYFWLFTVLLILSTTSSALAQSRKELEKQRIQLQKEIKEINSLLFQSQKKEKNLLSDLTDLNKRINVRKKLIRTIDQETNELGVEITENKKEIANLAKHLEALKEEYAKMVIQSYKSSTKQNRLMFVLSSENFLQAYKRIQYIKQYADYRAKQGEEIKIETIKLQNLNDLLEEKKQVKVQLIAENKREKDSINREKISQEKLIKKVKRKENQYITLIKKKQRQERAIDAKIEKLIREAIAKSNKKGNVKSSGFALTPEAKLTEKGFIANKGKLPAPVQRGVIVRRFGKQKHPTLSGITIESNGLQYATEKGADARVIFDGKVLAIQVLPGKKKAVLVQHGNYISVYKNLDNVTVNKGDVVKTKQNIGKIHTDKTTGKTILAFVLFKEINRQNPEEWIYKI
ncbi:MAG: peptidoglycan DD-metalloendopeptidase family protein [Bacteroidota bacterium]